MLPMYSIQSSGYSNHTNVDNGCMSSNKRFGLMNIEHRELVGDYSSRLGMASRFSLSRKGLLSMTSV